MVLTAKVLFRAYHCLFGFLKCFLLRTGRGDVLLIVVLALEILLQKQQVLRHAAGKSEVAKLDSALGVDEDVARFNITVHDSGRMDIAQGADKVVQNGTSMLLGEGICLTEQDLLQVVVHMLHDQKQILHLSDFVFLVAR